MKVKDIHLLAIVIRIFAIFLAVKTLNNGLAVILSYYQQGWIELSYSYLAFPILILFLALFLWFFPMSIARSILPYKEDKILIIENISYQRLFTVSVTILGLYFLIDSLTNMFYWAYLWFTYFNGSQAQLIVSIEQKAGTIATLAELLFSVILILGSKKLVSMFKWIRYTNTE